MFPRGADAFVKVGLTGALLAELAVDGQLTIGDDGTVRAGDTRPGDELLADVYDAVRNHLESRKASQVISGLSRYIGGSRDRVVDRLVDAGVLGRERPSVLRPTRHPVLDTAARQAVLDQVRMAANGEGPVRPDVVVVLALAGSCRLLERVSPDRSTRGEAKKQIARAIAETPFAPGVAKIVDELIAAVAVTATTTAASWRQLTHRQARHLRAARPTGAPGARPARTAAPGRNRTGGCGRRWCAVRAAPVSVRPAAGGRGDRHQGDAQAGQPTAADHFDAHSRPSCTAVTRSRVSGSPGFPQGPWARNAGANGLSRPRAPSPGSAGGGVLAWRGCASRVRRSRRRMLSRRVGMQSADAAG
jgi:Golgi phosphoprotein 3 (GPP34)